MKYKLLERQDLNMMIDFVDDENTKYDLKDLGAFVDGDSNYGFIAVDGKQIAGFAYGFVLNHPDGKKEFYFDAIDVMPAYQNKGIGTDLMIFARDYARKIGCKEMFLLTNKNNISACKCYEKAGGITPADDDVVYVYDFREKN